MSLQSIVRGLIIATPALTTSIPAERWKPSSSLTDENAPERMFAIMRWGTITRGMGAVGTGTLAIWVHDDPGTYDNVNSVVKALNATLSGVTHASDGEGNEIIQMDFSSISGDLYDPGFRTATKNITFTFAGRGL